MSHLFGYFQGYAKKDNLPFLPKNDQNYRKTKRSPKDHLSIAHLEATQPRSKRPALGDVPLRQKNTGSIPQPLKPTYHDGRAQPSENYNVNVTDQRPVSCHHCPPPSLQIANSHDPNPQPTIQAPILPVVIPTSFNSSHPNVSVAKAPSISHLRGSSSVESVLRGPEQKPLKEDSFSFSENSSLNNSLSSLLDLSDDEDENPVPDQHILPKGMVVLPNASSQEDVSSRRNENPIPPAGPATTNPPAVGSRGAPPKEQAHWFHEIYCAEYAVDIYNYLRRQELEYRPDPDYLNKVQKDLTENMRQILVDWLVEVAGEYDITLETLLLAKNYIDRYLSLKPLRKGRLQLLGITALLVASKYEELSPVEVENLVFISDNTYTKSEVLAFESELLNTLEFNMAAITEKNFLRRYLQAAVYSLGSQELANCVVRLSHYLIERTMQEYAFLKYPSSTLACSAICLAMYTYGQEPWTPPLEQYTAVTKQNAMFRVCVSELLLLFRHSWRTHNEESQLQSVNDKYQVLFLEEANTPPTSPPPFCLDSSVFPNAKATTARELL